jgi:hypothetical protein
MINYRYAFGDLVIEKGIELEGSGIIKDKDGNEHSFDCYFVEAENEDGEYVEESEDE